MADKTIKELIDEIKASKEQQSDSDADAKKTLESIKVVEDKQVGILSKISNSLSKQYDMFKDMLGDMARASTLSQRAKTASAGDKDTSTKGQQVGAYEKGANFADWLTSFFTGITALGANPLLTVAGITAAFAGLRGWEIDFVKKLKFITDGLTSAGSGIINVLRIGYLAIKNSSVIVRGLLWPIEKLFGILTSVGKFFAGALSSPVIRLFSSSASIISIFGKILKPIGILFSFYEAVQAFMADEEASLYEKLTAGVSAFLGDFFGAPLDLLKSLVSWALKQFGWDNASKFLDGFSIEENIKSMTKSIMQWLGKATEWVGTLFTDPTEALKQLVSGYIDVGMSMGHWVAKKILPESLLKWLKDNVTLDFGKIWNGITDWWKGFSDWVSEKFSDAKTMLADKWKELTEGKSIVDLLLDALRFTSPLNLISMIIPTSIKETFTKKWDEITEGKSIVDLLLDALKFATPIGLIPMIMPTSLKEAFTNKWNELTEGKSIIDYIIDPLKELWQYIKDLTTSWIPSPKSLYQSIKGYFSSGESNESSQRPLSVSEIEGMQAKRLKELEANAIQKQLMGTLPPPSGPTYNSGGNDQRVITTKQTTIISPVSPNTSLYQGAVDNYAFGVQTK